MKKQTRTDLRRENDELRQEVARLRGQVEALEKIVAAYRPVIAPTLPVPVTMPTPPVDPLSPFNPVGPVRPWDQPGVLPNWPGTIRPAWDHGGMCACPQCCPPVICRGATFTPPRSATPIAQSVLDWHSGDMYLPKGVFRAGASS